MSGARERRADTVELLPLKSALVNNNREDEAYYPPALPSTSNLSNLYEYTLLSKRTPASKRLLSKTTQPSPTPLVTLCGAPPPSRKREELTALANLRKKVAPALLPDRKSSNKNNNEQANKDDNEEQLDNRPKLLQRVLQTRPVSMVVQWSEVRTAWQDSDFITECLCWHNVYRQRHGAPQLYMAPEVTHSATNASGQHGGAVERGAHGVAGQRLHHGVPLLAQRVPAAARRAAAVHGTRAVRLRSSVGEPPGAHKQVPLQERPRRGPEPLPAPGQRAAA
ncbi:uncharacterized protein LOC114362613 isoform X2 [Ostrinia furnacalis]|uniref:uncharacterized protein LOC114362613 isoform X2 n=1 Tax=Ostrinia furnacalis TaxID=93504 RepID=UPI001038AB1F|nr:uncharacterized protein LOC114362613 isoform X2 [Ostrinia furnacalis]